VDHVDPPAPLLDKKGRRKLRAMYPLAARYVACPAAVLDSLQREFELVSGSWRHSLFVRFDHSLGTCRRIHLLSPALAQLMIGDGGLMLQQLGASSKITPSLNVVCAGLTAFDTSSVEHSYHMTQAMADKCLAMLQDRKKVRVSAADVVSLLKLRSVPQATFNWPSGGHTVKQGRVVLVAWAAEIGRDVGIVCQLNGGWLTVCGTVFEQFRLLCRLHPASAIETLCQVVES